MAGPVRAALPTLSPDHPKQHPRSPRPTSELCWFFAQGTCTYGARCSKSHDLTPVTLLPSGPSPRQQIIIANVPQEEASPSTNSPIATNSLPLRSLKADVKPFVPGPRRTLANEQDTITSGSFSATCVFFLRGFCRNGSGCLYSHDAQSLSLGKSPAEQAVPSAGYVDNTQGNKPVTDTFSREFHGAIVTFSAGAQVSSIKLASDFSTIQISGLPAGAGDDDIRALLSGLDLDVQGAIISIKQLEGAGAVAEVKVEDAAFATEATNKLQSQQQDEQYRRLVIKQLIGSSSVGTLGNRLQLSTVSCSWYQASCVAWLVFPSRNEAEAALRRLQSRKIHGRVPDCSIQYTSLRASTSTLQVGNLRPGTRRNAFCSHLKGLLPTRVTIGAPSYDLSNDLAASTVHDKLEKVGALQSFESLVVEGSNKMKALAIFVDRESASKAVRELHNYKISELGNSRLFLNQVISVKYNVVSTVVDILKAEIDNLRVDIWTKSHTSLKIYPPSNPPKMLTTIRLFGEGRKNVADAKIALEALLAGTVVMHGDQMLWDPYFSTQSGLGFLKELSKTHELYIHRDTRKLHLIIHGGSNAARTQVEQILKDKIKSLQQGCHRIILDPALLQKAMQGGMRDLKARFGSSVRLDISLPKTISITGSVADFQEAKLLLDSASPSRDDKEDQQDGSDCVVCWTEADNPLKVTCGHVYCKDCFNAQASANDGVTAVICAEEHCSHAFEMDELKAHLPHTAFENLRCSSFETYIRAHSKNFQYCPTPDCPQIYRPTDNGTAILCTHCLMSICTSCKVIYHDGMSCEDYKDLTSEGTKAFARYKKETDTRDCPRCTLAIQKAYGCNHMECANCRAHICWACMEVFATSQGCYGHMTKAHGSYGHLGG